MDQVDHEYLQEIMKSGTDKDSSASNDVKVKHVGVTFEQIQVSSVSIHSVFWIYYAFGQ